MQPFTFFISYRREDTAPIALLLKSEIEKRLEFVRVLVDVQELAVGEQFPQRLEALIAGAHATIALIGKHWMPPRGSPLGEDDWVVREIEYSSAPNLRYSGEDRLEKREILPLFADVQATFDAFQLPPSIQFLQQIHGEQIAYANWPGAIGPLIERIALKLGLKQRPEADKYPKPDLAKARTQPVADAELLKILSYDDYEGWYLDNFGSADVTYIVKMFRFRNFNQAADFMSMVSNYCRVLDHHPEWRNVFNYVTVALTTWDARRKVTIYDLNLALYMNMAAATIKASK
jgi:pterin-4a-carbinolamine dehydratase